MHLSSYFRWGEPESSVTGVLTRREDKDTGKTTLCEGTGTHREKVMWNRQMGMRHL